MSSQPSIGRKRKKDKRRRREVPQRTCVGCRSVNPKREMMRVVRTPAGTVEIDPSGKRSGRGAYLCQRRSCWNNALKRRSLEHALKITLDDVTKASLTTYVEQLTEYSEISSPASGEEKVGRG